MVSELDCEDTEVRANLKPFENFLDRSWLIPMTATRLTHSYVFFRQLFVGELLGVWIEG